LIKSSIFLILISDIYDFKTFLILLNDQDFINPQVFLVLSDLDKIETGGPPAAVQDSGKDSSGRIGLGIDGNPQEVIDLNFNSFGMIEFSFQKDFITGGIGINMKIKLFFSGSFRDTRNRGKSENRIAGIPPDIKSGRAVIQFVRVRGELVVETGFIDFGRQNGKNAVGGSFPEKDVSVQIRVRDAVPGNNDISRGIGPSLDIFRFSRRR